ncbi:MAG: glycosyltransferase [Neisseriaceae bacterium]|nr:MAG: glycosyltransferase [Neisseriaceae bacterium]
MINTPKISVVMPVYNAAPYLKESVESILNQTFSDFEFIIIDDCSTDNSYNLLQTYAKKDLRVKLFRNEKNEGLPKTLNLGVSLSSGEYIARMDADDISLPVRLLKQLAFMEKNPTIAMCGSWYAVCDQNLNKKYFIRTLPCESEVIKIYLHLLYNPFGHNTVMIRKDVFSTLQYADSMRDNAEDYDLWLRMIDAGYELANIPEVFVRYRTSIQSSSQIFQDSIGRTIRDIHKKYLSRLFGQAFNKELLENHEELIYKSKTLYFFLKNIGRYKKHLTLLKQANDKNKVYPPRIFNEVIEQLSIRNKVFNKLKKFLRTMMFAFKCG